MPLALRHRGDAAPEFPLLPELLIKRESCPTAMAALQGRSAEEMVRRFTSGHRAYTAVWQGQPVAWGWVATRRAEIGEVASSFPIRDGDRYLWNFVTRASHRGLGIYPRLLTGIVKAEAPEAERFWIAYAPENHASGAGIRKAGFSTVAELSFDAEGIPSVRGTVPGGGALAAQVLGIPEATEPLAPCWRCSRPVAGSGVCREGICTCDYQRQDHACGERVATAAVALQKS